MPLKRARRENVILRSPESEEFILAEIDDFNREIQLARQNKALMKFLDTRARQTETVSMDQGCDSVGAEQASKEKMAFLRDLGPDVLGSVPPSGRRGAHPREESRIGYQ